MNCVFCEDDMGSHIKLGNTDYNRLILDDENWLIYPTIGAFVEGYILHVLKRHTQSSFYCTKNELDSLLLNIHRISIIYKRVYRMNYAYIFEHGTIGAAYQTTCCIEHTHIHMLPAPMDILFGIVKDIHTPLYPVPSLIDCYSIIENRKILSYIILGEVSASSYFVLDCTAGLYPSQFMRMKMYKELVNGSLLDYGWDWRVKPYNENIKKTKEALNPLFQKF